MEYTLIQRQDTPVIGYSFVTTPFNPEIGQAWCRVHQNGDFQRLMDKSKAMENFGLCIMEPGLPEGSFRYMIGFDHDESKAPDPDMSPYLLKGGEYAAFRCPSMEGISDTYKYVYDEWIKASEYEYDIDRPADFEYYAMDGADVVCDIYVPVRKKG